MAKRRPAADELPPHSIESEQSVLGALLLDNGALERIGDLGESDFYRDDHRRIFRHCCALIEHGELADVVTVSDSLARAHEIEEAGGLAYLGEIANACPSAAAIGHYARIVRTAALKRRTQEVLRTATEQAGNGVDLGLSISDTLTRLAEISASLPDSIAPPPRLFLSLNEFLNKQSPADWLVHGIVQRGCLYACTAPTNHGKTAVMLVLLLCLASGRRFCGLPVTRCRVAVLCGENQDGFRARVKATMGAMGIGNAEVEGWFFIYDNASPLGGIIDPIMASMGGIGEFGAVLIETSISYFGGDSEDDNVQAMAHARYMRRICEAPGHPAVIANAHPIKSVSDREGCIPRGGSSFLNEIDTNLSIWGDGNQCTLHWTRKKRGPDFEPISFEFQKVRVADSGIEVDSIVALWINEQREAEIKRELNERETSLMRSMLAHPRGTLMQWATVAGIVGDGGTPLKGTVHKLLVRLESFRLVGRNRHGWFLTSKGRDEAA